MQLMWGMGTVHDLDCEDMVSTLIGFVGDRDNFGGHPDVVKLPKDNSWKWKTVKRDFDAAKLEAFYGDTANRDKFRAEGADRNGFTEETLPRLIYLPGKIGQYAAEQPRTLFELYRFTDALELDYSGDRRGTCSSDGPSTITQHTNEHWEEWGAPKQKGNFLPLELEMTPKEPALLLRKWLYS